MNSFRKTYVTFLAALFLVWGQLSAIPADCCCAAAAAAETDVQSAAGPGECHMTAAEAKSSATKHPDAGACHKANDSKANEPADASTTDAAASSCHDDSNTADSSLEETPAAHTCSSSCEIRQSSEENAGVTLQLQEAAKTTFQSNITYEPAKLYPVIMQVRINLSPHASSPPIYLLHAAFLI